MNHENPVSLYLVVPPSDINRTKPLMRMILNQFVRRLTETMQFKDGKEVVNYRHRLLLLLDEFPSLGKLDAFETALAYIAGYGLKSFLIIQSLKQLNKIYSENNSIVDNCHIRIVFTPNDEKTPEFISKLLGEKTETIDTKSYSGKRSSFWLSEVSTHRHFISRPLLTPGEVSQLSPDEELIFVSGTPPIRAMKIIYHQDKNFKKRRVNAPLKSDVIRNGSLDNEPGAASLKTAQNEPSGPDWDNLTFISEPETDSDTDPFQDSEREQPVDDFGFGEDQV
jgi:type IV secretion system protein VirD4